MKTKSKIFYWYAFLVVIYVAATLLIAPNKATLVQYHISATGLRWLDLTIVIPIVAIWFAAFYGYQKMSNYVRLIADTKDGRQIARLTQGILLLTLSLPIGSLTAILTRFIAAHHPAFTAAGVIISNYVNLLLPLAAFYIISRGTRGLTLISKKRPSYRVSHALTALAIVVGVLYGYFVSRPGAYLGQAYHLSDALVLTTIVIPYIYTWFLGILAAYEIHLYSRNLSGVIYRQGWDLLAFGLGAIVVVSVLLQYLGTLSVQLKSLTLHWMLLLVYVLLVLLSAGYVLLALGAKKLIKIEEV